MKEVTFNLVIDKLQKAHNLESDLSRLGLSVMELNEGYRIAIKALLLESFDTYKVDVINWYLYEHRKGKMIISDSKTKKTLYDLDKKGDLWKYMND